MTEQLLASPKPVLLFYCQHSLGIGHLTRSFALARSLLREFRVVFLNGGRLPPGLPIPPGIELIDLPPLGMDDGHTLVSRDGSGDIADVHRRRRDLIERAVRRHRPSLLLVELFPFGRKKFAGEILAMIRQLRRQPGPRVRVVCSLRDILVDARPDQQHHDDRARWLTDRYFDAVLVHADPALARLEDSFHPRQPLRVPVHYTGYVVPSRPDTAPAPRGKHLLVSAGGGMVGEPLFRAVLQARSLIRRPPPMRLVAGPFLPAAQWQSLVAQVAALDRVELVRQVPDMVVEMRVAAASISQCGYNTALDIVVARVPSLVLAYETVTENEQAVRAGRLAELGVLRAFRGGDAEQLARAIEALFDFEPRFAALDVGGAERSADILAQLQAAVSQTAAAQFTSPPAVQSQAGPLRTAGAPPAEVIAS